MTGGRIGPGVNEVEGVRGSPAGEACGLNMGGRAVRSRRAGTQDRRGRPTL